MRVAWETRNVHVCLAIMYVSTYARMYITGSVPVKISGKQRTCFKYARVALRKTILLSSFYCKVPNTTSSGFDYNNSNIISSRRRIFKGIVE